MGTAAGQRPLIQGTQALDQGMTDTLRIPDYGLFLRGLWVDFGPAGFNCPERQIWLAVMCGRKKRGPVPPVFSNAQEKQEISFIFQCWH